MHIKSKRALELLKFIESSEATVGKYASNDGPDYWSVITSYVECSGKHFLKVLAQAFKEHNECLGENE